MFPIINSKETGINLKRIMNERGISAKDVQKYLNLSSVQSVYRWWNGSNMPTIDHLYALSSLFQLPIDAMVCGNRKTILSKITRTKRNPREQRLLVYCKKIYELIAA